jgi:hypothetical protein
MIPLSTFVKLLRKATTSLNVRRSVHPNETAPLHGTNFHEISYLGFVLKFVDTFQFSLNIGKNNIHITPRRLLICRISSLILVIIETYCSL